MSEVVIESVSFNLFVGLSLLAEKLVIGLEKLIWILELCELCEVYQTASCFDPVVVALRVDLPHSLQQLDFFVRLLFKLHLNLVLRLKLDLLLEGIQSLQMTLFVLLERLYCNINPIRYHLYLLLVFINE